MGLLRICLFSKKIINFIRGPPAHLTRFADPWFKKKYWKCYIRHCCARIGVYWWRRIMSYWRVQCVIIVVIPNILSVFSVWRRRRTGGNVQSPWSDRTRRTPRPVRKVMCPLRGREIQKFETAYLRQWTEFWIPAVQRTCFSECVATRFVVYP